MTTYMVYTLTAEYNDQEKKINRRFSDFFNFREALRCALPFNFIFPVHKKQTIGNKIREFLIDRTEELNSFFAFIVDNIEKFKGQALEEFLNTNLQETDIGK